MGYSDYALHLLCMTTGKPHPAAEKPIIRYPHTIEIHPDWGASQASSLSITNSRLAILLGPDLQGMEVVVWDWRTGGIVFVSGFLSLVVAQGS